MPSPQIVFNWFGLAVAGECVSVCTRVHTHTLGEGEDRTYPSLMWHPDPILEAVSFGGTRRDPRSLLEERAGLLV